MIGPDTVEDPPAGLQPAGLSRRLPATIIDMVIYCGCCALLAYPVSSGIDWSRATMSLSELWDSVSEPTWMTHAAGILGLWIALWWCYFAVGWGLLGATIGKFIVGVRIVDHRGRSPIGLSRAFLRLAAYSVSSVTLGMGHLLIVLRHDRRALHDVLAGTWVVRRAKSIPNALPNDKGTNARSDIENDEL